MNIDLATFASKKIKKLSGFSRQLSAKTLTAMLMVLIVIVSCWIVLHDPALAATGTNKTINFQGKVTNSDGTNVNDGSYSFTFNLYTGPSGGTATWTETKTLTVTDGIFQTALGDSTSLPGSVDFNTDNIYLGIEFNSDGEMTPRVQFAAVPQAFNALKVAGLTVTDTTGTFTLTNGKTLTVQNSLTLAGTDSKTLTLSGSTTLADNAITFGGTEVLTLAATKNVTFADAFTTSGTNPLTLTTTGSTNVTLPTTGTLATLAGSESLSNKTLVSPTITTSPTAAGATWANLGSVTTIDINGGTIDGTVIGGSSTAAGSFTTLNASSTVNFSSLSASSAVYTDGSKNLTTTAPSSGTLGYWSRSSTTLSPATAGDNITTSGKGAFGTATAQTAQFYVTKTSTATSGTNQDGANFLYTANPASTTSSSTFYDNLLASANSTANSIDETNSSLRSAVLQSVYSGDNTLGSTVGALGTTYNTSSGTVNSTVGFQASINNTGTGTIANARGLLIGNVTNSGGGAITSSNGITVNNQSGATNNTNLLIGTTTIPTGGVNYSIYNSSSYQNYFAGNTGIGTTAPNNPLEVRSTNTPQVRIAYDTSNYATEGVASNGAYTLDTNSTGGINIGTGANSKFITIGNSTGTTGLFVNSGGAAQNFSSGVTTGLSSSGAFVFGASSLTSGTGMFVSSTTVNTGKLFQLTTGASDNFTSGTLADIKTVSSSLSGSAGTGSLMNIDWSPGSVTTATGDLFALNIGANGTTTGSLFNILDSGSSIFSISETAVTTALPANFTASGDVSIAYDINFTNPTASYIKSAAPLNIYAGETFNSSNLNLGTYNQGTIVFDTANTTSTALDLTNTTLTSGIGLNISGSNTAFTGDLTKIELTGNSGSSLTGNALKVGITGTTASGNSVALNVTNGNTGAAAYVARFNDDGTYTDTSPFLIKGDGNVGIGLTSPSAKLEVQTAAGQNVIRSSTTGGSADQAPIVSLFRTGLAEWTVAEDSTTGDFAISVNPASYTDTNLKAAAKLTINSSGNVGIGTTAPTALFEVKASGVTTGTIAKFTSSNTTGCTLATGGTIACSSDRNLKKNIADINYGLDQILQLRPVEYNWKTETDDTSKSLGFIAQEVETVIPKLVSTDSDSGYKQLNTIGIVPVLAKSIQQLNQKIDNSLSSLNTSTVQSLSIGQNGLLVLPKAKTITGQIDAVDGQMVITSSQGRQLFKIDQSGNAFIAGTLTVGKLVAGEIDGLQVISDSVKKLTDSEASNSALITHVQSQNRILSDSVASTSATLTTLSKSIDDLFNAYGLRDNKEASATAVTIEPQILSEATSSVALNSVYTDGIATFSGQLTAKSVHIQDSLLVESVLNVVDMLTTRRMIVSELAHFLGDVMIKGNLTVSGWLAVGQDSAGTAVITKNQQYIYVQFSHPYEEAPLVNTTISLPALAETATPAEKQTYQKLESDILAGDFKYIVTDRGVKGFSIKINKTAPFDLTFNWTAVTTIKNNPDDTLQALAR